VTPVYKLSTSSMASRTTYGSMLAGNPEFFRSELFYVLEAGYGSPYVNAYQYQPPTGWLSKYADPATTPGQDIGGGCWNADGTVAFAAATSGLGNAIAYPFNTSTGFGTKYSNPSGVGGIFKMKANSASSVVAIANNPGQIQAVNWNNSTGWGSVFAAPGTLPGFSLGRGVAWHPNQGAIAVSGTSGNYLQAYAWSGGWSTKYSNPSGGAGANYGNKPSFNNAGTAVGVGIDQSPNVQVWQWSSGFSTKYSDPATTPGGLGFQVSFNPNDTAIGVGTRDAGSNSQLSIFTWSNATGFGTRYTTPAGYNGGEVPTIAWTADNKNVLVSSYGTPYVWAYPWDDSTGYGTKYANPATTPTNLGVELDVVPRTV